MALPQAVSDGIGAAYDMAVASPEHTGWAKFAVNTKLWKVYLQIHTDQDGRKTIRIEARQRQS